MRCIREQGGRTNTQNSISTPLKHIHSVFQFRVSYRVQQQKQKLYICHIHNTDTVHIIKHTFDNATHTQKRKYSRFMLKTASEKKSLSYYGKIMLFSLRVKDPFTIATNSYPSERKNTWDNTLNRQLNYAPLSLCLCLLFYRHQWWWLVWFCRSGWYWMMHYNRIELR